MSPAGADAYPPIRDYALIGDCHGAALVSRHGSIDWCCLGRFDADPIFCRILDARNGGFLSIRPVEEYQVQRGYLEGTNILRTVFSTRTGKVALTDFMPVGREPNASVHDYVSLRAPQWLARVVEGIEGEAEVRLAYRPNVDFARRPARLAQEPWGARSEGGPLLTADFPLAVSGETAEGTVRLRAGERRHAVVSKREMPGVPLHERLQELYEITRAFWEEWIAYCRYKGAYADPVRRSALALKLLTYAPSGAIVAAPTTSLPEEIGGERNWDYRYCWLRDATFTLYALAALGYSGEARRFAEYVQHSCKATHPQVQIMYGIEGETELTERTLDHLEGYRGSRPVRTGNGASCQQQLDVYGEILDWSLLYKTLGGRFKPGTKKFWEGLCQFISEHWNMPGHGLWEMRGPRRHHVFGKIMSWVAVDRTIRLLGETPERARLRETILDSIREHGIDPAGGHLRQAYELENPDAALLLVPALGLPLGRETLERTVAKIEQELRHGDYVHRYRTDDGLRGSEGAFLICSFWLVDALLLLDRRQEARGLFERLCRCANDVGLYSEEIDPETHEFLGNFPQAFTHLALIQSATNLELHERHGPAALRGTAADRARFGVQATAGLRALWAAFKQSGRVGRLRSSRASILGDRQL